ncbi:MAG: helix-turn-helix domain-containing protein [Actinomycetota bacterium]
MKTTLRDLRKDRGLTIEAVALIAGVDKATISRVERGLTSAQSATVVKLAKGLGLSVGRLVAILKNTGEAADEPTE